MECRVQNATKITLYNMIYKNKNRVQSLWLSTNTIFYFSGTVSVLKILEIKREYRIRRATKITLYNIKYKNKIQDA